jgi:hypothetical protein
LRAKNFFFTEKLSRRPDGKKPSEDLSELLSPGDTRKLSLTKPKEMERKESSSDVKSSGGELESIRDMENKIS